MNSEIFIGLLNNAALLLALSIVYEVGFEIPIRFKKYSAIISGFVIGSIGIAIMIAPIELASGVVFDCRSILIGTTSLIFGFIPTVILVVMTSIFRIIGGGAGLISGLSTIFACAAIGLLWKHYLFNNKLKFNLKSIYIFGFTIHFAMLASMLWLPWTIAVEMLESITLPVLIIYPIGTVLLCMLLIKQNERKDSIRRLTEAEERFETMAKTSIDGYYATDQEGYILEVNDAYCAMSGYKREDLLNLNMNDLENNEYSDTIHSNIAKIKINGWARYESRHKRQDGSIFNVLISTTYVRSSGSILFFISNITERKKIEMELSLEKKLLKTTLTSVGDGVISTDYMGNIVFLNKVGEMLTGWTQEDAKGKSIEDVFNIVNEYTREKNENIVKKVLKSGRIEELANHTILIGKDGFERPIEDSAAPIIQENGEIIGVVLVFRDFSDKKLKQEEIEYLSYHDQLTGLYNRRFYEEELMRIDVERNLPLTIIMGDVNGLKLVNDSFGHAMGDELLQRAAEVINNGCRADDIIARLGGDEFVIILPKTDVIEAENIIKRIKALASIEKVGSLNISIAFGYCTKTNKDESIQVIFKETEDQMYKNKLFESSSIRSNTIELIMNTLYEKNGREMFHSERVSEICDAIASKMNFDKNTVSQIKVAGLMHDIGKIGIDEKILNNPQILSYDEWKEMKRHPEIGYRILSSVNEFSETANYVLEHQERWDGKGYPRGLKGVEISIPARIIALADAFDAMTSERPYKKALNEQEAIEEIKRCAGTQFDPEISKVLIEKVLGGKFRN